MSFQPLTWRTDAPQLRDLSWRAVKRNTTQRIRSIRKYFATQYYITNALSDCAKAIRQNEDIAFGGLVIMGTLSFAGISLLANLLFYFVMTASILSFESGINIALLIIGALSVIAVLSLWLTAFLQNIWMYALYEGSTRKQYKSLRLTVRNSLHNASQTTLAWGALLLAAVAPGSVITVLWLSLIRLFHIDLMGVVTYIIITEVLAVAWAAWVLLNFSLLPQVALFGPHTSWTAAALHAKQLVSQKGRLFTLFAYTACILSLTGAYLAAWSIHHLTGTDTALIYMLLGVVPITALNSCFTMLYRKRRLARS